MNTWFFLIKIKRIFGQVLTPFPSMKRLMRQYWDFFSPYSNTTKALKMVLKAVDKIYFVQIGANDGRARDPLYNLITSDVRFSGIFIEPNIEVFERLRTNYATFGSRFTFENIAISDRDGEKPFYFVDQAEVANISELRGWTELISSFSKHHVSKHLPYDHRRYIKETVVKCLSFSSLLDKFHLHNKIDLLHIDTEGHDHIIIKSIDFEKCRPKTILFESCHMSNEEIGAIYNLLRKNRYKVIPIDLDTLAILN